MTDPCRFPAHSGRPCAYPADSCPLHPSDRPETPPSTAEAEAAFVPRPLRLIGQLAAEQVSDGTASPLQASRLIRSLRLLEEMGHLGTEEEERKILREVELRGVVMSGFPPRNEEEWLLACEVFDDEAIEEFTRWERCGSGWGDPNRSWVPPVPEHMLPLSLRGPQPAPGLIYRLSNFLPPRCREYYLALGWENDRDRAWEPPAEHRS